MNLTTTIAGLTLAHPVMNAAGTCKLLDGDKHSVRELSRSAASAIMVGSITMEERSGNSGEVYCYDPAIKVSLNALGLPNRGFEYYRQNLPTMVQVAHDAGKLLFVSLAGFNVEDFRRLFDLVLLSRADIGELNFGCPNVRDGVRQHPICSFYEASIREILAAVQKDYGDEARVAVKLSPFSDPHKLVSVAETIADFKVVKVVTSTNTFPNGYLFADSECTRPRIGVGYAGVAGPAMKPIGLGQIHQLRAALPNRIQLMGVGGVGTAQDVREYQAAGATVVQTATSFLERGPQVFSDILQELVA